MNFETIEKNASKKRLSNAIVKHYEANKRPLPWRTNRDPYRIWVSEIMLQQTQVATVIPFYKRWLKRFPNVKSLAEAESEEVLSLWTGLGYYRRCRFLHDGAKQIVNELDGTFPKTAKELLAIKGIGRYTAGAISSIAFGLPEPIVDGNVERLLSRVFEIKHDVKSKQGQHLLWQLAEWLVPNTKASEFNQGMMELGATICKPKSPKCDVCPLFKQCQAAQKGTVGTYPIKTKPVKRTAKQVLPYKVAWISRRHKILLCRRNDTGLFPGIWELPHSKSKSSLSKLFTSQMKIFPKIETKFEHVLSHRLLDVVLYAAEIEGKAALKNNSVFDKNKWFSRSELSTIGLSSAMKRLIEKQLGALK